MSAQDFESFVSEPYSLVQGVFSHLHPNFLTFFSEMEAAEKKEKEGGDGWWLLPKGTRCRCRGSFLNLMRPALHLYLSETEDEVVREGRPLICGQLTGRSSSRKLIYVFARNIAIVVG